MFLLSVHALSGVAREIETPSTKAVEGVFSVSIILIALVVLCDQDLLGRLSFDSVGRALRPNLSQAYKLMRGGARRA